MFILIAEILLILNCVYRKINEFIFLNEFKEKIML
jgi:hypothetical protein